MKQQIKDDLNILFLKDIGHLLLKEEIKYMIVEKEDSLDVKEIPIYYNDYLYLLYDYLAYDFDQVNSDIQKKYILKMKHIKMDKNQKYQYETKTYVKKNS